MSTDGQPRRNHLNHKEHEAHQRPHKDDLGSDSPGLFRPGFANRYGEEMGWLKMKSLWFPWCPLCSLWFIYLPSHGVLVGRL